MKKVILVAILVFTTLFVSACGGGGGSDSTPVTNITVDTTAPVLSDIGKVYNFYVGDTVTIRSVTAVDDVDGSVPVSKTGTVDSNTIGSYSVVHSAKDSSNNSSSATDTYNILKVPNNAPTVTDDNISIVLPEYTTSITDLLTNVSDTDGDNLTVLSIIQLDGNTTLPTGYSLTDGNLTIDATSIDVADGVNLNYDLNVTVTDSEGNVSYIINSTIQDSSNDAILTATDIDASATVNNGTDLNISLVVIDTDGVDTVTYNIYSISDVTTSLDSGILNDDLNDGNYSATTNSSSLAEGDYNLVVTSIGVDGGEGSNSEVTKIHNFTIITPNTAPTWTASSYAAVNSFDGQVGDHTDDSQELLDLTGLASDAENDTLTYAFVEIVSIPDSYDTNSWDSVTFDISNNKVYISGLQTANPTASGDVTIKISVSDGVNTSFTNIVFKFSNV